MVCPNCGTDGNLCECALANMPQSRAVTPVTNSPVDVSLAASWPDEAARVARNPDAELAALDPDAARAVRIMAGRAPDGVRLANDLRSSGGKP